MSRTDKNWIPYSLSMLISPLGSLFLVVRDRGLSSSSKKWLFIIFITIFGSVLSIKVQGPDAYRHQERVEDHYVPLTYSEFSSELYEILTLSQPEGTTGDVYLHVLGYFVGGVMQMPGLFFTAVGFIYAFFYVGSIFKLFQLFQPNRLTLIISSFLLAFITWKTIQDMQTVRTYTGLWVMFYGGLSYFETGKNRYWILMVLPPLIHLGYFIMTLPLWTVAILKNRKMLFAGIFFISFFTQIIPEQWALSQISRVPIGVNKIEGYYVEPEERTVEGEATGNSQNMRFYAAYEESGLHKWGVFITAFALILFGAYFLHMGPLESSLFSTGLLAKALSNGTFFLYALTNRLDYVAGVFILAAIILLLGRGYEVSNNSKFKERLEKMSLWAGWGLLAPYFIYKLAEFVNFGSFFLVIFPFVPWLTQVNFSIKEFILSLI